LIGSKTPLLLLCPHNVQRCTTIRLSCPNTNAASLQILKRAELLTSKRVGQWTFYKRDEAAIAYAKQRLIQDI
jgi:hypothetical protein